MKTTQLLLISGVMLCLSLGVYGGPATDYKFVLEFGEQGPATNQFTAIDGVAVDRFGRVFVTDINPRMEIPELNANGFIGPVAVKRWTTNGQFELAWVAYSKQAGEAEGIDCSCDGDPFYVTPVYQSPDIGADVEHSDPDGMFFERFPPLGFWNARTFRARDVAISADGRAYVIIYLTVYLNDFPMDWPTVFRFNWTGSNWVPTAATVVSNSVGELGMPWGIDADPWRQRVYVSLVGTSNTPAELHAYDMDLVLQDVRSPWPANAQPLGVGVDNRDGSIFVVEAVSNMVYKYAPDGTLVTSWGGPGAAPYQFNRPTDVDVDWNGWVYVADADNYRVQIFAPPLQGNLNFIVRKSKIKVNWKQKAKGKDRDVIIAKGIAAVDVYTNLFGLPAQPLVGMPCSFYFNDLPIITEMPPTKTNPKGTKALYKPDKDHKVKLIYRPKGALILVKAKLKRGNIDGPLGITDTATLPPWQWVTAQLTLSNEYLGVHYMRLEHKNKVGKRYKAIKK
jgi:hypothetical protein